MDSVRAGAASPTLLELPVTFRFSQALALGVPEGRLRRWLAEGRVERIGRGTYRRADSEPADADRVEAALRAPRATICLTSALAEHDLVDDNPARLDLALPRGVWRPRLSGPVRWHSFAVDTFDIGRELVAVDAVTSIGLYGPQRSVIDAFRLRHDVGPELGVEALRRWLRLRGSQPGQLLEMARSFPAAEHSLTAALQVLL